MRGLTTKMSAVVVAVLITAAVAFAQTPKRIDFAKEGKALVWEQSVPAKGTKEFVFYLQKGQKVSISYIEDTRKGTVDFGKYSIEEGFENGLEMEVEVSKDYTLTVGNPTTKPTSFRISISLEETSGGGGEAPDEGIPSEAIELGKADFATVKKTVAANSTREFTFQGEKGLIAHVTPKAAANSLEVMFCGRALKLNKDNTCKLDTAGEWSIIVRNATAQTTPLTLEVSFEQDESAAGGAASADSDEPVFEEEQIQFAKGQTDTTLEQTIAPNVNKTFLFRAKKGQIVWFKVTDKTGKISVDFNKNPVKPNVEVRQTLNASGEWAIYVSNSTNKAISYTLWIGIE